MEYKNETRNCQNCKKDFVIEQEDFNFYEKIKVPPPTFCPECRAIRRMTWRNERSLFHRICDFSGKKIISMFHPESRIKVYDRDIWWSDDWDPSEYGQDYDFNRPFFEQFNELLHKVPLASLGNTHVINSAYGNHNLDCKDCFLLYASYDNERVHYSQGALKLKDCMDTYSLLKSSFCYEDVLSGSLYQTHFSYDSDESINSFFLKSCVNCQNCIGCMNLRNKSYCIFNEQYSVDEYLKIKKGFDFGSYKLITNFKHKYKDFVFKFPHRYAGIIKSKNCTGDNILNSKNTKYSFDIYGNIEDSKFVAHGVDCKDSYDCYGFGIGSLLYEVVDCGNQSGNNYFSVLVHGCLNTSYVYMCYNSKNIFGSIGIRKGEYYILNKKYSKKEYEELVPKIIQHMNDMPYIDKRGIAYKYGEFFPSELSLFAYNETIAQEYFTKTKESIVNEGYEYRNPIKRGYKITLNSNDIPDHIMSIPDTIIDEVIECPNKGSELTQCTEAFKIRKDELDFLKKNNIALPRFCPNCRHYQRLEQRNPLKLWQRQCMCGSVGSPQATTKHLHGNKPCKVEFETSYAPDRPEIIYCEKCYQQEVY